MAVLIEAISVVVRRVGIESKLTNGWREFQDFVPNRSLCSDADSARVGFMSPDDVRSFFVQMKSLGLDPVGDLVVVDQRTGPTTRCDWIEFSKATSLHPGVPLVATARLTGSANTEIATPENWNYEGSISATYVFVPNEHVDKALKYLRTENGVDVYRSELTGKEVFLGRA